MCKRLNWGLPLLALVVGVSPALAFHHHPYAVQSYHYQSYQYAPLAVQSYQYAPLAVQSYQYAPLAVQSYQYAPLAVQSYQYAPLAVQSYQYAPLSVPGSNAQAVQSQAVDLMNLFKILQQFGDIVGGGSGDGTGTGSTALAARVSKLEKTSSSHEKRLAAIEKQLKLKPKQPTGSTGGSGAGHQFDPNAEAVPEEEANAEATADPIQALLKAMQAVRQANDAQQKAARGAAHELDYRIGLIQDQLNDMKSLRDQLKPPPHIMDKAPKIEPPLKDK